MEHVIKRQNNIENYIQQKLYRSIYAACLAVHTPKNEAKDVANKVTKQVTAWVSEKNELTSNDIRVVAAKYLNEINPHASYLYAHHRIIYP